MYQLYETAIHHLFVQDIPRQQGDLVGIQLLHRLCRQFVTNSIVRCLHKHLQEGIHALHRCLLQISILHNHLFHTFHLFTFSLLHPSSNTPVGMVLLSTSNSTSLPGMMP